MSHPSPRFIAARHSENAPLSNMMKGGNRLDCLHVIWTPERYAHGPSLADSQKRITRG
jgi:hypothetical protein